MFLPLFVPAHNDKLRQKASQFDDDWEVILDLEDAVPADQKDRARQGVVEFLQARRSATYVRINPVEHSSNPGMLSDGETDLCQVVGAGLTGIVLPKVEKPEDLIATDAILRVLEARSGMEAGAVEIIAIVESALGIANLQSIVTASVNRRWRLSFGAGDYTTELGIDWTETEKECQTARALVVIWSRSAGLPGPIDSAFPGISNSAAFTQSTQAAKSIGFAGKFLIHPSQRPLALEVFHPSERDIAWAQKVVCAAQGDQSDRGAFMIDGKMVDEPIVARARQILSVYAEGGN